MDNSKLILDACCGSRMFWFDKENPLAIFADIRDETHTLCDGRELHVNPDILMDFTDMPFKNNSFKVVVWDPPHMKTLGPNAWMSKKYGRLTGDWKEMLRKGFAECWRVCDLYGVIIFKWNETEVKLSEVLPLFDKQPLFGHTTGKHGKTIWLCFLKNQ